MLEAKLGFSPLREVVAGSYSPHFPVNQVSGELCRDPDIRARLEQPPRSRGGSRDSALSRGSPVELHPHPTQHQKAADQHGSFQCIVCVAPFKGGSWNRHFTQP